MQKNLLSNKSLFFILLMIGLACRSTAPSSVPLQTQSITATAISATQSVLPITPTPSQTPKPIIDLSFAIVQPGDIPIKYGGVQLPSSLINITSKDMLGVDFINQQVFFNLYGGKVTGFAVYFENDAEKNKFSNLMDTTTHNSNVIKEFSDYFYDSTILSQQKQKTEMEDVGETRKYFSLSSHWKYNKASAQNLDILFFTRGNIGVFVSNLYSVHDPGYDILHSVAKNLDDRIEETLQNGIPLVNQSSSVDDDLVWLTPLESTLPKGTKKN